MPREPWTTQIERLRRFRVPKPFNLSLKGDLAAEEKRLTKRAKAVGGLGDKWETILPPDLASASNPERLSGGILTIKTADSAAKFALDRWLRSGGEAAIKQSTPTTIVRIRLV